MNKTAVALLAKAPIPGQVKTRFCPPCTPDEAATFARAFLRDTAAMLDGFAEIDRWCSYAGPADELRELLGGELLEQRGEGLGERIANATADLFAMGYENVIALCADCPTVNTAYMQETLLLLQNHDVVFGPARDGGCLHVALSRPGELFFRDVEMSTDHVFNDMQKLAEQHSYLSCVLPERYDLDYLTDLLDAVAAGELTHAHNTLAALQQSRFAPHSRTVTAAELDTPLTSFEDAVQSVLQHISVLPTENVALAHALDRVVAHDITSIIDVPPFPSSSMDGYAVQSSNPVIEVAAKIMTGWPVPDGRDAVVPWEHVDGDRIASPRPGQFIRPQGEDVRAGSVIVTTGTELEPAHLGLLAACGYASVDAIKRPRAAVLVTGDELVAPGSALATGKIYDSDSVMLRSLLERAGVDVVSVTHIGDSEHLTAKWFREHANDIDLLVTAGGASVGEHDWVRTVLDDLGTVELWRVALKPGKPFAFGRFNNVPVFVLPGNPASVLACSHAFVLPAIRKMSAREFDAARIHALISEPVHAPDDRTFLCPVTLGDGFAHPMRAASSSVVSNHLGAHGYAVIPPGGVDANADVIVELFD